MKTLINKGFKDQKLTIKSLLNKDVSQLIHTIENYDAANLSPQQASSMLEELDAIGFKKLQPYQAFFTSYGFSIECIYELANLHALKHEPSFSKTPVFSHIFKLLPFLESKQTAKNKKQRVQLNIVELNHFPVTWVRK